MVIGAHVQVAKSPPRKITKEDAYLAESAKRKTGGASALAKLSALWQGAASKPPLDGRFSWSPPFAI